jgi:hypothetical protein
VFSHIYLDNLSPAKLSGFWARAGRNELTVDNFFAVFIFNDFNAQSLKSLESCVFIDFSGDFALFECPACEHVKSALQALINAVSTQSIRACKLMCCSVF